MQPREIVRRSIRFEKPPRLPVQFDGLGCSDFGGVSPEPSEGNVSTGTGIDPWGCRWEQADSVCNMGQVRGHPITDLAQIERHPMPDYSRDFWWRDAEKMLTAHEAGGRYGARAVFRYRVGQYDIALACRGGFAGRATARA